MFIFIRLILIVLSLSYSGCKNSYKPIEIKTNNDQVITAGVLDFLIVNQRVIQPHCVQCHSESSGNRGQINLESYESVFKNRVAIYNTISNRTMPPRHKAPLTDDQMNLILSWINQGAHETGAPADEITAPGDVNGTVGTVEIDPGLITELKKPIHAISDSERLKIEVEAIAKTKNLEVVSGTVYPKILVTEEGYTVLIVDAQRTALLYESNTDAFEFKLKLDLTENLCQAEYIKPQCNYHFDFGNDGIVFRWIKHNDEKKIGQTVKTKLSGYGEQEFSVRKTGAFYGFIDRFVGRKNDMRFKPDLIVCNRYDWLDKKLEINKSEVDKSAQFASWSSESMILNPETEVNENATDAVFENIYWKFEKNALVMQNVGRIQNRLGFGKFTPVMPIGQASTIQYLQANGETCQFSFTHSIQTELTGFDIDKNFNENPRFVVYKNPKSAIYKSFESQEKSTLESPHARAEFE